MNALHWQPFCNVLSAVFAAFYLGFLVGGWNVLRRRRSADFLLRQERRDGEPS